MSLVRLNIEKLGLPVGPYSHAVAHGNTLYTSGFTAFGTGAEAASAGEQTHAVLDQLDILAGEFDGSLADLVKVTVFVTDTGDIPGIRAVLTDRYDGDVPASSLVMVAGLFAAELKIEIDAVFALQ